MDMTAYRNSDLEQERVHDLIALLPKSGGAALDVGARDGYFSVLLTDFFDIVTALDLKSPEIAHEKVRCVAGDVTALDFPDRYFDLVFCAEVLEHVPPPLLEKACFELQRVAKDHVLVGVPYRQDIRVGRTTCYTCGKINPPWGHVNAFDENRLKRLFSSLELKNMSFVGENSSATNFLSARLMDLAGNPYGVYWQEEPCIHCGSKLVPPPQRSYLQKAQTRLALFLNRIQRPFIKPHPNWLHVLFGRPS